MGGTLMGQERVVCGVIMGQWWGEGGEVVSGRR